MEKRVFAGKKKQIWPAIVGAFVLQVCIIALAIVTGVMEPVQRRKAAFNARVSAQSKADKQEVQDKQMSAYERTLARGTDLAQSMKMDALQPLDLSTEVSLENQLSLGNAMLAGQSFFSGAMTGVVEDFSSGNLGNSSPVEFMGESIQATKIVLLVDISSSVKTKVEKAGWTMERLRDEVRNFISKLGPNHLFGVLQFSRKIDAFQPELVPATVPMKAKVESWLENKFRVNGSSGSSWKSGNPNGIQLAIKEGFAMDPQLDEIIIISDGDFQMSLSNGGGKDVPWEVLRNWTKELQEEQIGTVRISHIVFFPPEKSLGSLKAWVRENGEGRLTVISN